MKSQTSQRTVFVTILLVMPLVAGTSEGDIGDVVFKLTSDVPAPEDYFGGASPAFDDRTLQGVATDGQTILVGAPGKDSDDFLNSGAVYVFDVGSDSVQATWTAREQAQSATFGTSVALEGNTALIGSAGNDESNAFSGVAYLFDVDSGNQRMTLTPNDPAEGFDGFGWSVDIDGGRAVVGAPFHTSDGADFGGSAYVFDVATGQQLLKLGPPKAPLEDDWFGSSVAIQGNNIVVGSFADATIGNLAGSAFVFDAVTGEQRFQLQGTDTQMFDKFGHSVDIESNQIIVGAPAADDDTGELAGAAYLFDATTGQQQMKLTAGGGLTADQFGWSVTVNNGKAIVGATTEQTSGGVHIIDLEDPSRRVHVVPEDLRNGDGFGWAVAAAAGSLIAASPFDDDGCPNDTDCQTGAAYLIELPPPRLLPGDADRNLQFDQLDLVRVLQSAKYLTGDAATWGEGDWDGAPGGTATDPPAGDGLFNQDDIVASLVAGVYLTGPYAASIWDDSDSFANQPQPSHLIPDSVIPQDENVLPINVDYHTEPLRLVAVPEPSSFHLIMTVAMFILSLLTRRTGM